ncbi:J domain-containing protein [Rhizobium sp. XQZ8]|uniref:J domain-containing protein n=1 Tax=Rhizobium populisoli TaxID=2859785 RepID=UPI001C66322A|nr:J domain-containing protein [Rhizobium populisoli]MBW6419819.1 J domain-containing protein [Rhizobium populisoli]
MIDPYEMLGVAREADGTAIKSAYRKRAKTAHPDAGGDVDAFAKLTTSYELLCDPLRRKVYDDTGYDPELADTKDLQGLVILETLVNEIILDEREPGSFDPVSAMRRKLTDKIVNARFHILEMERHRARIRNHIDRIGKKPGADVLGRMLRSRCETINDAITKAEVEIGNIEQAYGMLDGYSYEVDVLEIKSAAE